MRLPRLAITTTLLLFACGGASANGGSEANALLVALADSTTDHAVALRCLGDFQSCLQTAGDPVAIAACKVALASCLPDHADGSTAEGSVELCEEPHHSGPHASRGDLTGGYHRGLGGPDAKACRDRLDDCVTSAEHRPQTCVQEAHRCIHAAIESNFTALCEDRVAHCRLCSGSMRACAGLSAACAAGVPFSDHVD